MNTPLLKFRAMMAQQAPETQPTLTEPLPTPRSASEQAQEREPTPKKRPGRPRISPNAPLMDYHLRVPAPLFLRLRAAGTALVRKYLDKFKKEDL